MDRHLDAFERLTREHGEGLLDFWRVYDEGYDELTAETMVLAVAHPEFGPLIKAMPPDVLKAQNAISRARMERGLTQGDWKDYIASSLEQGPTYARMGISFSSWYEIVRLFQRALVPRMVKRYAGEPERLSGAVVALMEFLDLGMGLIAEQYLGAREEQRFQQLVAALGDGVLTLNDAGTVLYANDVAGTIFGRTIRELVGQPATTLVPEGLLTGLGRTVEHVGRRADGSEVPVEVSLTGWRSGNEQVYGAVVRDITERKAAEDKVRRAREAAEHAKLELEAFSYSVAHDLRSPLRGIDGFSRALLEDAGPTLDADAKGYLDRICAAARRMDQIIDALLALSRVSRSSVEPEAVDLAGIARSVAEQLRSSEPARAVDFSTADAPHAYGDPRLMRVLLENLLGNAWKFTRNRDEAHVRFGAESAGDEAVYFVRDDGAGFDGTYAAKLFLPFQRLHRAAEFPGTGIGLATVARIVQMHGGRIWAEGAVDRGATFRFTLPAAGAPDAGTPTKRPSIYGSAS